MSLFIAEINSVVRSNCSNGDVRLVGGSGSHEGRVEVCINEAWGSICSNGWDDKDADIVCKQLGFLPIGQYIPLLCTYCITVHSNNNYTVLQVLE